MVGVLLSAGWYVGIANALKTWRLGRLHDAARELSESNGKLLQRPVHEAERYASSINLSLPAQSAINMFWGKRASSWDSVAVGAEEQWCQHYGLQLGTGMRLYIDNQSEDLFCGDITHTRI